MSSSSQFGCLLLVFAFITGIAHGQGPTDFLDSDSAEYKISRLPPVQEEPAGEELEELEKPKPEADDEETSTDELGIDAYYPLWKMWGGSVELGLNGTEGNTQTNNLRFGVKLKRETPFDIHTWELTHLDKSNDGEKTALSTLLDGRLEWPLPDTPWTYYVHGLGEYDKFKAFDVRASGDSGVGYQFINNEHVDLVGRIGGSFSREFGGPSNRYVPELSSGIEWHRHFNDRHSVSTKVEYFPDVTEFAEYRLNSTASWEIVVAPDWGLSLKLNAISRYDSTPSGARSNDLDYSVLLLWDF